MAAAQGTGSSSAGPSGLPSSAPGHSNSPAVAVWEWQDEFGRWRPYRGSVCSYIEQVFQASQQKGRRLGPGPGNSIPLGHADAVLAPYVIDIPSLTQFRQDTGTMRSVRRHLFPQDSAAGQGVVWEWQNDEGGWSPYEMNVCVFLEQAHATNHQRVDLGPLGYNYEVDFVAQVQTNKTTKFRRSVQRRLDVPYPVTATSGPVHAGMVCSCQQCWFNSGTGPITMRYRHSMINFPNSSTAHQVSSRTTSVSASGLGFVPYNKPALYGARSTTRLNAQSTWALPQAGGAGGPSTGLPASNGLRSQRMEQQGLRPDSHLWKMVLGPPNSSFSEAACGILGTMLVLPKPTGSDHNASFNPLLAATLTRRRIQELCVCLGGKGGTLKPSQKRRCKRLFQALRMQQAIAERRSVLLGRLVEEPGSLCDGPGDG
ncbi:PREDICTED: probable E3 ubiquitin-protein ligase DTX2 [Tinamus guttatus]|uniref:probable E3 ubiquitin-protein ligase DTX2 n=1 Tax=Tinamus guttatus TaxID=94827 RepID=UPI00052ED2BA|nr:PREDICTED: probable E3 ubiquitin-protein ligase DTX2 [Tinamus guttatus]